MVIILYLYWCIGENAYLYGKDKRVPKEEQCIFENHHPAIIDKATFALVQELKEKRNRTNYSDSSSVGNTNMLSDYAAIKNGSYGKLMKAYYAKQDAEKLSGKGDTSQKLTLMKTSADSLKKSADALNDSSLWEKEKIKKKDEKTGEEIAVEDYDWDKITKAVKSFVEDYNDVVREAGESNTKDVLRNASWMTGMTDKNSNMLAKIGITIGKGNKLELDEDALKQADISSLKTVFTGYNSFVSKISQKATGISNAANRASATYTNNGTYSKTDSSLTSSKIDKEV